MPVTVAMTQPSQVQQRFVEQPVSYNLDAAGPDPELKKVLPLVFASLNIEVTPAYQDDSEFFAPLYVDNTHGTVKKSVSAQKTIPIAPEDLHGISTYFSRFHPGIDYRATIGTSIHAVLPGVVNEIGFEKGGYGRYIVLVHHLDGKTLFSLYAHMRATHVIQGDTVEAGQKIGEVGLTGHTTGPHLHFELHDGQRAMDPLKFFSGSNIAMVTK